MCGHFKCSAVFSLATIIYILLICKTHYFLRSLKTAVYNQEFSREKKKKKKPGFGAFAYFCGINTTTMPDFNMASLNASWEKMSTISS